MVRCARVLQLAATAAIVFAGCAGTIPSPPPEASLAPRAPVAPGWVAGVLIAPVGPNGAAAARDHLFRSGDDGELFAGLVAFATAQDPELRRVAAFHLSGMVPVAERCGVPAGTVLEALRKDSDAEVRRLADLHTSEEFLGQPVPTGIVSGEARVGEDRPIPYPGLSDVRVHLLVRGIEAGRGAWPTSITYRAEARLEDGGVLGASGSEGVPEVTGSGYMGILTDEAQYGWNLWLRVLDDGTVRWWLQGLRKPLS